MTVPLGSEDQKAPPLSADGVVEGAATPQASLRAILLKFYLIWREWTRTSDSGLSTKVPKNTGLYPDSGDSKPTLMTVGGGYPQLGPHHRSALADAAFAGDASSRRPT